jgi:hypothetical protein
MISYEVGIGRVQTENTGWVDCVFAVDYRGYTPSFVYSRYKEMDCWATRISSDCGFVAALSFCKRKDIKVEEVGHIYYANSGGWALWVKDEDAPDGWRIAAHYDKIAESERRRGA